MTVEIRKLISIAKTSNIVYICLICDKVSIYNARNSDGRTCAHCGGHISPVGYAKSDTGVSKPFKRPYISASESEEQAALFQWAAYNMKILPDLEWLYHIPNGGKRHKSTAIKLKAEGVKPGVPDICLPVAKSGYHGLYIELKAGKNTATDNQNRWLQALTANGYYTAICYGWENASTIILEYLRGDVSFAH